MTTVVFEFKKTNKFKKNVGKHSVSYELFFFKIWVLHDDFMTTIEKIHNHGFSEGRKTGQKDSSKFSKN